YGSAINLLGMGGEGQINPLFPHTVAGREQEEFVVALHDSPKPPSERLTPTLPASLKRSMSGCLLLVKKKPRPQRTWRLAPLPRIGRPPVLTVRKKPFFSSQRTPLANCLNKIRL